MVANKAQRLLITSHRCGEVLGVKVAGKQLWLYQVYVEEL